MRSLERHRDAGAYALGVLDDADAFRFEDHLMDCARCRARLDELDLPVRLLRSYGPAPAPLTAPDPRLLDRLVDVAGRARRVRRRRWVGAVVAGVVLAVAGPTAAVLTSGGPERVAASGVRGEVSAVLTARGRSWGTEVGLRVRDLAGPRTCRLVAVGVDGSEETVTTWRAVGRVVNTVGSTGLRPEGVARYEIRTLDGARLLTLPPPHRPG
ncbi:anti-sigma factor family protein [Streptomyces sp. NPDC059063]|uniref:anti-sigma factor family protein n=1 Tax=unclassified Streptomyces TaxID=2593676 RepID=UPI0036AD667A